MSSYNYYSHGFMTDKMYPVTTYTTARHAYYAPQ